MGYETTKSTKSVKSPFCLDWGACLRSGYGLVRVWSGPFRSGLELTDHLDGQNVKKNILGESRFPLYFPFKSHNFGKLRTNIEKKIENSEESRWGCPQWARLGVPTPGGHGRGMATSGPPGKRIAKNPSLGELLFPNKLAYVFLTHLQLWPKIDKKTAKSTKSVKSPLGQDWGACLRSGCGLVRAWSGMDEAAPMRASMCQPVARLASYGQASELFFFVPYFFFP